MKRNNRVKNVLITQIVLLLFSITLFAQSEQPPRSGDEMQNPIQTQPRGNNLISSSAYHQIKYQGKTIPEINSTSGSASAVTQLFGSYNSVDSNSGSWGKSYKFGLNTVHFNMEQERVTVIELNDDSWNVSVLGSSIKVGDSFSSLQQKYGNNLKINYRPEYNPQYNVSFTYAGNETDGLLIDFNPATHTVVQIVYFVNP